MIETDRVLRPLKEAEPAIEQLDTYESPAVLTEALRATWHAVDRTLRILLRSDASAPDHVRMTAMSPEQMSVDAVMIELRRRDFISLGLAGRIHALRQALDRALSGTVLAADADNAREVVRRVVQEVHYVARRSGQAATSDAPVEAVSAPAAGTSMSEPSVREGTGAKREWDAAHIRPLVVVAVAVLVLAFAAAAVVFSGTSRMEQGIAAFREDRPAAAEQHFRAALQESPDNNTARLYLARILRRDDRHEEAGQLLQAAVAQDDQDSAVRRELGYLFLDLNRPSSAAGQFRRAVEVDAADPLNWAGMVHALRVSGDSAGAEEWLRRAPEGARELVGR